MNTPNREDFFRITLQKKGFYKKKKAANRPWRRIRRQGGGKYAKPETGPKTGAKKGKKTPPAGGADEAGGRGNGEEFPPEGFLTAKISIPRERKKHFAKYL